MEIKRKKITDEEIFETERGLADKVSALCGQHAGGFESLGYELDLEFGQKEDEAQRNYAEFVLEDGKRYETGYVSRALITVRRKKTEEELSRDEQIAEENRRAIEAAESETEAEQLENDETLRLSEDALKRAVAFTEVMLVRAYKSFWTEWVSICDGLEEVDCDLKEFFQSLSSGSEDAEYQSGL